MTYNRGSQGLRPIKRDLASLPYESKEAATRLKPPNWETLSPDQRANFLIEINTEFTTLINELTLSANLCVARHKQFGDAHLRWKRILIATAGIVAVLNLFAVNKSIAAFKYHPFPLMAAIAAILLTVIANLDSFYNSGERAQAYREAREMFVDARRQLGSDWDSFVRPLADTADACSNAAEMYRRAIATDRELRTRFKKLTTIPEKGR